MQMVERSAGKGVEADNALPSPPKQRPGAEKRRRVTEVQRLEISGGTHSVLPTEKGTSCIRRRREKESSDEREQPAVFREPCMPQETKARGKGPKQKEVKESSCPGKRLQRRQIGGSSGQQLIKGKETRITTHSVRR